MASLSSSVMSLSLSSFEIILAKGVIGVWGDEDAANDVGREETTGEAASAGALCSLLLVDADDSTVEMTNLLNTLEDRRR